MITQPIIDSWFTYQTPKDDEHKLAFEAVRNAAKTLAETVVQYTPSGVDQDIVVMKVREVMVLAHADIVRGG